MTPAQLVTFGNDIRGNTDPAVVAALAAGNNNQIRDWYNQDAAPDHWVFIEQMQVDDAVEAMDWATDYTAFQDDMNAFLLLFRNGSYGVAGEGARNALNSILSGANSTKNALLGIATRLATEAEKLFTVTATGPGGGDGSASNNSANTVFVGQVTRDDVRDALAATA